MVKKNSIKPTFTMITKTLKTLSLAVFAAGFAVATMVSCGPKKEEVVEEEETIEEVAPPVEEIPADTTMMDSTVVDSVASN